MISIKRRWLLAGTLVAAAATLGKFLATSQMARAENDPGPLHDPNEIARVAPGAALPDVTFASPDGAPHALSAYRGHPLVLNFWATWCTPCVSEMPELDKLAATSAIPVLAVSGDRGGADVVAAFYAKHGLTHLPILLDPHGIAATTLQVAGFPTTLIVDAQGRLRGKLEGPAAWSRAGPRIQALLA